MMEDPITGDLRPRKADSMTSAPNTRPAVVVIATSWGRRHGGINSFSTDLCTALAAIADHHRVVCVALSADDADRADAASADVLLLTLHLDLPGAADPRWTPQVFGVLAAAGIVTVDHWVGHDAITGAKMGRTHLGDYVLDSETDLPRRCPSQAA
jgi:hypothetical protein